MSLIIAARFPTFDAADAAARRLIAAGVHEDAIHVFYVNPPGAHDRYPSGGDMAVDPGARGTPGKALGVAAVLGGLGAVVGGVVVSMFSDSLIPMLAGAGVGAYVGSLAGAMSGMDRRRRSVQDPQPPRTQGEGRPAGVMLAVNSDGERAEGIAKMLVAAGGQEVERAHGRWRGGKWEDFDPLAPPVPQTVDSVTRDHAR